MRDPRPELLPAQPKTNSRPSLPAPSVAGRKSTEEAYGSIPLSFELNRGQADSTVKYLARGSGYVLFLSGDRALLALGQPVRAGKKTRTASAHFPSRPVGAVSLKPAALQLKILRASPNARVSGFGDLPGRSNYFIGNDPTKWKTNIPNYSKVRYEGVYPGVDLVFYGSQGRLEYDFVLCAGVNPEVVSLGVEGAKKARLSLSGDLILRVGGGEVVFQKPSAYQGKGDGHAPVAARFVLTGANSVGFEVGPHDSRLPLVIDPVLSYSTYLGGTNSDQGIGIAVDSTGNAYVTGTTLSADFPTTAGAFNQTFNTTACVTITGSRPCFDVFVAKLNPAGSALVYSTYLGGRDDDSSTRIAVDVAGNAYVTGTTASSDFPLVTPLPFPNNALQGSNDAFVTKLNATGSALVYSTYLGGTSTDQGSAISVDASGSAYVTGFTNSLTFPTTLGAFQITLKGTTDAFVTKFTPAGSSLAYSTFLGGSVTDQGLGIAVDSSGSAHVTGLAGSADFPVSTTPAQASNAGGGDAFVTKLSADGSTLVYSTFLGGTGNDQGQDIAVDSSGNAYVTGITSSTNFPTVSPPVQPANAGGSDAFVSKLNPAGSALVYSTYLGGKSSESGNAIAVDSTGNAYVTGQTTSFDFPTASPFEAGAFPGDAFVTKLNATGSGLLYSSYLGGSANVTGFAGSTDFPTLAGSFQITFPKPTGGPATGTRAFVVKVSPLDLPGASLTKTSLTFADQSIGTTSPQQFVTLRNVGSAALTISTIDVSVSDFSETNDCISGVAGGSSCTVRVTFSPTARGLRSGTLSVNDNASGSPHQITLSGNGIAPAVTLSASSLTYPSQNVGTASSPQTVTLTNTGLDPLAVNGITSSGEFPQTNTCPATLAIGASCTITVTFTPTAPLARTGTLAITDNAPGNPHLVQLSGTGVGPAVTLSKTSLAFGEQPVGTTSGAQTITLTNSGNAQMTISGVGRSGDFAQANNCGPTLDAGLNCTINVTFTPKTAGTTFGAITIGDNAPGNPQLVGLSGNAVSGPAPEVFLSSSSLSLGSQPVTTTTPVQTMTLTNTGNAALTITGIAVTGNFAQTNDCGTTLNAGASCTFSMTFTPLAAGTRPGALTITDNASGNPQSAALSGVGTDFGILSSPSVVTVPGGQSASYKLTLGPVAGFKGDVSLGCSGAPPAGTCIVNPVKVTLDGTNLGTATVTVTTTALSGVHPPGRPPRWPFPTFTYPGGFRVVLALLALGLAVTSATRRLGRRRVGLLLAGALLAGLMGACAVGTQRLSGTIPGNYLLTISGTTTTNNGTLNRSIDIGLTVN
jgi:hypothetical protein